MEHNPPELDEWACVRSHNLCCCLFHPFYPPAETFPTDPYVRVRMGGKLIHQTSVHPKTRDPVFTIRTGSLFVLCATPEDFFRAGGLLFVVRDFNTLSADEFLGSAYVSHTELLNSRGARIGYDLIDGREHASGVESRGCLYLRIREATVVDIQVRRYPLSSFTSAVKT